MRKITPPGKGDVLTAEFVRSVADAYRWVQGIRADPTSGLVARKWAGGIQFGRSGWPEIDAKLTAASTAHSGAYAWHLVTPAPGGLWADITAVYGDDAYGDLAWEYTLNSSITLPFYTRLRRVGNEWRFPGYSCS